MNCCMFDDLLISIFSTRTGDDLLISTFSTRTISRHFLQYIRCKLYNLTFFSFYYDNIRNVLVVLTHIPAHTPAHTHKHTHARIQPIVHTMNKILTLNLNKACIASLVSTTNRVQQQDYVIYIVLLTYCQHTYTRLYTVRHCAVTRDENKHSLIALHLKVLNLLLLLFSLH